MLILPLAVELDVVVLIAAGDPAGVVLLAESERPDQVPGAMRAVAVNLDLRIEDVMLREADELLKAREELPDGVVTLGLAEIAALPDTVARRRFADSIGIVIVIANIAVERLELLDRLDILEPCDFSRVRYRPWLRSSRVDGC